VREEFIVPIVELLARSHSSLESAALRVRVRAANNERGLLHRIVKLADRGQLDGTSEASILCGFCQRCVAAALPLDRARDHHAEKEINGRGTCVDTHRGKASAAHPPF
jgi:hypothetical protein